MPQKSDHLHSTKLHIWSSTFLVGFPTAACLHWGRERLVAEREGAARAWESSLRSEQASARQALLDAAAKVDDVDQREAVLREGEQVLNCVFRSETCC